MKRYMKQGQIDFFESPHPSHFDLRLFREARPDDPEDPHLHPLFTPLRPSPRPFTPLSLHDSHCLRLHPTAFPFDPTSEPIQIQESFRSDPEINEKLEFSEEQPIPITPEKLRGVVDEGQTTARKSSQWAGEGKFYERGLKKLAYEAFRFVSNQKKTTYKEVATKLINQLNDDNELDIHRKGEMNIKRRVYDALNVLIALGLLKRNGNKILGKKPESDSISLERDKQRRKEQSLEEELDHLRSEHLLRTEAIRHKQNTIEAMRDRLRTVKQLTLRNRALRDNLHSAQPCVSLPFLVLVQTEGGEAKQSEGQSVQFWKEGMNTLHGRTSGKLRLSVSGDIDAIAQMKMEVPERQLERVGKRSRTR